MVRLRREGDLFWNKSGPWVNLRLIPSLCRAPAIHPMTGTASSCNPPGRALRSQGIRAGGDRSLAIYSWRGIAWPPRGPVLDCGRSTGRTTGSTPTPRDGDSWPIAAPRPGLQLPLRRAYRPHRLRRARTSYLYRRSVLSSSAADTFASESSSSPCRPRQPPHHLADDGIVQAVVSAAAPPSSPAPSGTISLPAAVDSRHLLGDQPLRLRSSPPSSCSRCAAAKQPSIATWLLLGASSAVVALINPALLPTLVAIMAMAGVADPPRLAHRPAFRFADRFLSSPPGPSATHSGSTHSSRCAAPPALSYGWVTAPANRLPRRVAFPLYNHQELASYVAKGEWPTPEINPPKPGVYSRPPRRLPRPHLRRCFRFWLGTGSGDSADLCPPRAASRPCSGSPAFSFATETACPPSQSSSPCPCYCSRFPTTSPMRNSATASILIRCSPCWPPTPSTQLAAQRPGTHPKAANS